MVSLCTNLSTINLTTCITNASGCYSSTHSQLNVLPTSIVVSKSGTLIPRSGNDFPRFHTEILGSINSMGLPNEGYEYYAQYQTSKSYIQSIYPFNIDELTKILLTLNNNNIKIVELNVSCPNVLSSEYFEKCESYFDTLSQMRLDNIIVGAKMMPLFNMSHYHVMSDLLLKSNIKFITCCNSIPNGLMINYETETACIKPNDGLGGISGSYLKPISLANVYNFHKILQDKVDIVGCGGIKSGIDAFEYILCGAKLVQVGTQLINEGPSCLDRISNELRIIMGTKKYSSLNDFRGNLLCNKSKL